MCSIEKVLGMIKLITSEIEQENNNYKIFTQNVTNGYKIFFETKKDKKIRDIGILIPVLLAFGIESDKIVYTKTVKEENIMRKGFEDSGGGIGFCWDVIKNLRAKDIINIYVYKEKIKKPEKYYISMNKLLEKKDFLYFKDIGFEKQCFISLNDFKKI